MTPASRTADGRSGARSGAGSGVQPGGQPDAGNDALNGGFADAPVQSARAFAPCWKPWRVPARSERLQVPRRLLPCRLPLVWPC